MDGSPFNRSGKTLRSPPSTPVPQPPEPAQPTKVHPHHDQHHQDDGPGVISTIELQDWMKKIEKCLNEVCVISCEGKLNSDQKLRINNLCRNVSLGTSQLVVQYQSLKSKAIEYHHHLNTYMENQDLSQQLQNLTQVISVSTNSASRTASFADMVKKSETKFVHPVNTSSVAIYPADKNKTSEDTKSLVQKIIRPEQMKLQVRGLRKTKNGGVIISTDSKGDIEKLKKNEQLTTSGLTIDEPQKRRPRIIVVGVPTSMQDTEVFNCIFQQNLADKLKSMTTEKFLSSVKLSHKSGKKNAETCNYVIEVTAEIRKALITKDRVFVNWSSCPVRDFTLVTRCYKCQQYGHAAKTCRGEKTICGHCGEDGHDMKECPKKAEPPKCATCMHYKKPCNHKTGDLDCPARKMAETRYISTIDYEGA